MLLRTSSAPLLSALNKLHFSPGEVSCSGDPTQCINSSSLSSSQSLASPFLLSSSRSPADVHGVHPLADEWRTGIAPVWDLNTEWISRPQPRLSRAQSEGDLACFSAAMASTPQYNEDLPRTESIHKDGRVHRVSSHSALSSFDLKGSIAEETERDDGVDQSPASAFSRENSFSLPSDIPESTKGYSLQGLQLNHGEVYTSLQLGSCGSPTVCNARSCRRLTEAETKTVGFLDMASGVGLSSGSGYLGGHLTSGPDFSNHKEGYYRELIQADPENPLLLRNYAELLAKKGELAKSEEYYERAILADPNDGEVLSQYAKLQWDVKRDQGRAEAYYGQALKASPDDCYVMASYASFLWDIEDNEECVATPVVANSGGTSSHIFSPSCIC